MPNELQQYIPYPSYKFLGNVGNDDYSQARGYWENNRQWGMMGLGFIEPGATMSEAVGASCGYPDLGFVSGLEYWVPNQYSWPNVGDAFSSIFNLSSWACAPLNTLGMLIPPALLILLLSGYVFNRSRR